LFNSLLVILQLDWPLITFEIEQNSALADHDARDWLSKYRLGDQSTNFISPFFYT
jgi:hypothetical protein